MAYGKLSIEKMLAQHPDITILELATKAAEDHTSTSGCSFHPEAGMFAVLACGFDEEAKAALLTEDEREVLARALEALEIDCPHKTPANAATEAKGSPLAAEETKSATTAADVAFVRPAPSGWL